MEIFLLAFSLSMQIRVNSVRPGLVLTEMSKNLHSDEKFATALLQRIPLGRFSGISPFKYTRTHPVYSK